MRWFRSSEHSDPAVGATVSARNDRGVRSFPAVAVALAAALAVPGPAGGAPITVLVSAAVGEDAQQTMPAALWLKLVSEYVGPAKIVAAVEPSVPDEQSCRAAHAAYALLATFDRLPRLPGTAQEIDREYAVARFTLRNCVTGVVSPAKFVRIESDPVAESARPGDATAETQWGRAVRATLAANPLALVRVAPGHAAAGVQLADRPPERRLRVLRRCAAVPGRAGAVRLCGRRRAAARADRAGRRRGRAEVRHGARHRPRHAATGRLRVDGGADPDAVTRSDPVRHPNIGAEPNAGAEPHAYTFGGSSPVMSATRLDCWPRFAIAMTSSPSARRCRRTPLVERPARRIWLTGILIT